MYQFDISNIKFIVLPPKPPKVPQKYLQKSYSPHHPQTFSLHLGDELLEVHPEPLWALGAVRAAPRTQCGRLGLVDLAEIQEPLRLGGRFSEDFRWVFLKSERITKSP